MSNLGNRLYVVHRIWAWLCLFHKSYVCVHYTLNCTDYMQEVGQTEQNYVCLCVYHSHKTQLFWLGYGSPIQMSHASPSSAQCASKHPRNSTVHSNGVTQSLQAFCRSPCTLLWCGFALAVEGQWGTVLDCKWWLRHLGQWRRMGDLCCRWLRIEITEGGELLHMCLTVVEVSLSIFPFMLLLTGLKIVHLCTCPRVRVLFLVPPLTCPPVKPSCVPLLSPSQVPGQGSHHLSISLCGHCKAVQGH